MILEEVSFLPSLISPQCLPLNDRFGRKCALALATLVYIAGVLGQGLNGGSLSGMYASRFITGIGIGGTTVVPPIYISEVRIPFS